MVAFARSSCYDLKTVVPDEIAHGPESARECVGSCSCSHAEILKHVEMHSV